jgi:hypothetical protein
MTRPSTTDPYRGPPTPTPVRVLLAVTLPFVGLQGAVLFLLPEQTDRYFSWTVVPPITATFMGAVTLAGGTLVWSSLRQTSYVQARLAIVSPWAFWVVMGVVTFVHLDRFHLDSPHLTARLATWVWIVLYIVVPLWFLVVVIAVGRRGIHTPARFPLSRWFRSILVLQATPVTAIGLAMLVVPHRSADGWPWSLSPLTARTVGAWLLATGVLVLHAAVENDLDRMFPAAFTWLVSGLLQGVAILRHLGDFEGATLAGSVYLAFPVSLLLLGAATLWLRDRAGSGLRAQTTA